MSLFLVDVYSQLDCSCLRYFQLPSSEIGVSERLQKTIKQTPPIHFMDSVRLGLKKSSSSGPYRKLARVENYGNTEQERSGWKVI